MENGDQWYSCGVIVIVLVLKMLLRIVIALQGVSATMVFVVVLVFYVPFNYIVTLMLLCGCVAVRSAVLCGCALYN